MADEKLQLEITLENGQFKVAAGQAEAQIGKIGKKAKTTADTGLKSMTKAFTLMKASIVGVIAGKILGKFIKLMGSAVKAASALEEQTAKFNTVFKSTSKDMQKSVDVLTKSYNMSTREAKQNLAAMQDLLVPMGLNADVAAEMSENVVKLSGDLGSFNNMPTADVMRDIQSALVGNFETMKKYGVVLNETVIKQEAMNLGLFDGKGQLDAATKAQVAYELIVKGSKFAIGDLERTQGSYANQVKRTTALTEDFMAALGGPLKDRLAENLALVNENRDGIIELGEALGKMGPIAIDAGKGIVSGLIPGLTATLKLLNLIGRLKREAAELAKLRGITLEEIDVEATDLLFNPPGKGDKGKGKKPPGGGGKAKKFDSGLGGVGVGPQEDPLRKELAEKNVLLAEFTDTQVSMGELVALKERERQEEALVFHEQVLRSKAMLDSRYVNGLQTVFSAASTFMAQKQLGLFRFGQVLAIGQAIMNTATGITKTMAQWGWPLGLIGAAIIGTAGGLQIAQIAKQKPPKPPPAKVEPIQPAFAQGSFSVPSTGSATVHQGEMITPQPMAEAIRQGDAVLSAGAKATSPTINVAGNIIDTAQLLEITDGLRNERAADMGTDNYSFRGVYK